MPVDKHNLESQNTQPPPSPTASPEQTGTEPSGYRGDNPSTAGSGKTGVRSNTPENSAGHLDPSAPENANVTPGSVGEK